MNALEQPIWFVGDLDDPWVTSIAEVLPPQTVRISCGENWDEAILGSQDVSPTIVLHRPTLTPRDREWLSALRKERTSQPRVVLCLGPYARYVDLERCLEFVDAVVPEATARDTILRHVGIGLSEDEVPLPAGPRPVQILSSDFELRNTLATACRLAGYRAKPMSDWGEAESGGIVVWDVPVLEPEWPNTLAQQTHMASVVTLLGFADRALVREARAQGAAACLESPCDLADLFFVLERLGAGRCDPAHGVPPPPVAGRRPPRSVAEARQDAYT